MRNPNLSLTEIHHFAYDARESMTPAEIDHAARVARASMRLTAKFKDQWRRQCRDELGEMGAR